MRFAAVPTDDPATEEAAFLGVGSSVSGRRWVVRSSDGRLALAIAQKYDLPEPVARVLAARGVDLGAVPAYLDPTLKDGLPDPDTLQDMTKAAARIADAIERGERVAVFGDYDVDGATSSSLLHRFFRAAGRDLRIYIPDRIEEGYGPNGPALRTLAAEGISLVITVDCGTAAHEALAAGRTAGLDIIVVDHHQVEGSLPDAVAVVNPNRPDDLSGCGHAAAAGVAFLLVVATNRELRTRGWYGENLPEPDLRQWLDLVALGTVCDVVPLQGFNRAFVLRGLKVMEWGSNAGLAALREVAGLKQPPDVGHLGFALGPRVNAGGRVGCAGLGARLLCTEDPEEAAAIAEQLDRYNRERRDIEQRVLDAAMAEGERLMAADLQLPLLLLAGKGWHPGVIGIVASRVKDRFGIPAIVCCIGGDGVAKGSGRSVPGVDLGAAVIAAREEGLLTAGGGHSQAAGLTVKADQLSSLRDFLCRTLDGPVTAARPANACLRLDGGLTVAAATRALHDLLMRAGPFGAGNPQPRFALADVRVVAAGVMGKDHVCCTLAGARAGRVKAVAFRASETHAGQALLRSGGARLHVAGRLKADDWRGRRSVQVEIDDVALADGPGPR